MLLESKLTPFKISSSGQIHFESFQLLLLLHSWSNRSGVPRNSHKGWQSARAISKGSTCHEGSSDRRIDRTRDNTDLSVAPPTRNKGLPAGDGGWLSK